MTEDQLQLMCGLVGCDTKFPLETFKIWDFQLDFFFFQDLEAALHKPAVCILLYEPKKGLETPI